MPWILFAVLGLTFLNAVAQEPGVTPSAPLAGEAGEETQTVPVVVDGTTLFSVRGVSAFPAEKRAATIVGRIQAVAADRAFPSKSLRLEESSLGTRIMAGNLLIMTVVDADAKLEGIDRHILAPVFRTRIGDAIEDYRHDRDPQRLARQALYAVSAMLALLLGIWVGQRVVRRIRTAVERRFKEKVRGVQIQSFQVLHAEQLWRLLSSMLNIIWMAIAVSTIYITVNYILSLFPWTRGLANGLWTMLINPLRTMANGLLREIPNLVFLMILGLVTRYLLKLIRLFFAAVEKGTITLAGFDAEWSQPTYRLIRVVVIALALVVGYPYIPGSDSQAFKGVSLFIGVIFSLGSTSFIGNMIAGYSMAYRRTFKVGDRVKIGDHIGDVAQTGLMVTYLRTPKNEVIVVPNSTIINGEVINYSMLAKKDGLILHTTVGIGYETPWRQVEAILVDAAARTPGLLREPKPFVLQRELGDFAVTYEINAYCGEPGAMFRLYTALHQNTLDLFNEYGIQIMTPAYEGDPERAKVVPKDQWYSAPARPPDQGESGGPID